METHTLARYISESTLQHYQFVAEKPSLVAAASMYLALRMKKLGGWVSLYTYSAFSTHIFFGGGGYSKGEFSRSPLISGTYIVALDLHVPFLQKNLY